MHRGTRRLRGAVQAWASNGASADAAREAGKAADSGAVKLSIHGLQGKRQELVEEFGKVSLALYQEKQIVHSSLDEVAARLSVIDQEIGAKEAQLQAIEEKYKTLKH